MKHWKPVLVAAVAALSFGGFAVAVAGTSSDDTSAKREESTPEVVAVIDNGDDDFGQDKNAETDGPTHVSKQTISTITYATVVPHPVPEQATQQGSGRVEAPAAATNRAGNGTHHSVRSAHSANTHQTVRSAVSVRTAPSAPSKPTAPSAPSSDSSDD